ncbi:zinc finger protein 19-like [Leguminivora glycinivorella]|uniref:zinc finger protein 19-like n=1 Tax=Leguminivora glycinivorella TaxID=1035111 RepID=UPI0020103427|nr:zinc finger protein 19-like [Leguminivora glycinivorella]
MSENFQNCCRICLDVDSEHVSIHEDPIIHLHIKSCLAMTISATDTLPKEICGSCVSQLSEFYNFQLNARCSQDLLESSAEEQSKKSTETKTPIQPLPDSEYNSDSLLEFLNNTANIEEYLHNLGKEDIPSIVNMLDRNNENSVDGVNKILHAKTMKNTSPIKKNKIKTGLSMEVDVLDSDIEIVQEILMKESPKKIESKVLEGIVCFACGNKFDTIQKLSQHISVCDNATRTCLECSLLCDSRRKMLQHRMTHNTLMPLTCACGKQFQSEELLTDHFRVCHIDYMALLGCNFRCKQCGECFKERFQLYRHARGHIMKAQERACDICGHRFIGDDALAKHKLEEHNKSDKTMYRCKVCGITSSNHKEIYTHILGHTAKTEPTRHLCESCGRSFSTHTSLARHAVIHKSIYSCTLCDEKFTCVRLRDDHLLEHREMTMCERCGGNVYCCELEKHSCC